ncbi:MAG: RimK/LysX family protein [Nanoarchaeota archaeon]|nr:RimK/LysX family protein [Nanoarchaeota archaeon]MCG2717995.1 RimK/LysX family protein [Nanoarchaeota archaeon]
MKKTVIGLIETVKINGKEVLARIDTGAEYSSIDESLAEELELGPVIREIKIRSASGKTRRPIIKTKLEIKGKILESEFNLANRKHMKYKILVGQDILKDGFLIDPEK